jgi:large subunit ribosomal protein L14e
LSLTDHVVKVPRNARQTLLTKAVTASDVKTKFANSTWGKKLAAKEARANTSDFDRFKITVLKKRVSFLIAPPPPKIIIFKNDGI